MFDRDDNEYIRPTEEYLADCGVDECRTNNDHTAPRTSSYDTAAIENELIGLLESGERMLWCGRTDEKAPKRSRRSNEFGVGAAVFWIAFSVIWTIIACIGAGGRAAIFGAPFIIIGFFLLKMTLKQKKQGTLYAITDRRVIVKSESGSLFYALRDVKDSSVDECKNGYGFITFRIKGPVIRLPGANNSYSIPGADTVVTLYALKDPKPVYNILRSAIISAKTQGRTE